MSTPSPSSPLAAFTNTSLLSVSPFSRDNLLTLLHYSSWILQRGLDDPQQRDHLHSLCKGAILSTLFFEPSTRTCSSFQAACLRLGGTVLPISDISSTSMTKGETLEDTIRCISSYVDLIVMRHPVTGSVLKASAVSRVPVINAGDGIGEHPTQALLDCLTIWMERVAINGGRAGECPLDGLTITMVGDLLNGRTVHSLSKILTNFRIKRINYIAPGSLKMPREIIKFVADTGTGIEQQEYEDITSSGVLPTTDILYVTRIQKERFKDVEEYKKYEGSFCISKKLLDELKVGNEIRILHPLPRVNELSTDLDDDPRAAYFRQMRCGMAMRMAIIAMIMGKAQQLQHIIQRDHKEKTPEHST